MRSLPIRTVVVSVAAFMLTIGATDAMAGLNTVQVIDGLIRPIYITSPPGDFERLFYIEQNGTIKIIKNGVPLAKPFLNITSKISCCGERGLLGLAFHPDYETNGYFFVNYTRVTTGATWIERYKASETDPDTACTHADSILKIIEIAQDFPNHNGGCIQFGPDGMLYVGMGDGGSGYDPNENAQDPSSLLGKMLRFDIDIAAPFVPADNPFVGALDTLPQIWAFGLRNPWRWSFDRATGDLYIGDVGQDTTEEIDYQPAASTGGENYGWRCMEGSHCLPSLSGCGGPCPIPGRVLPISEYDRSLGYSVTGGYVYRGCAIPWLDGAYIFADYGFGNIWSFRYDGAVKSDSTERTADLDPPGADAIDQVSSFGEDAFGELYIVDYDDGEIYKIVSDTLDDCNTNNRSDRCDIAFGFSTDVNANQIPDECEGLCACDCFGDPVCNGVVNVFDVVAAVDIAFRNGDDIPDPNVLCPRTTTDVTCDGVTNVFDVVAFVDVAFRNGDAAVVYCDPCA